MRDLERRLNNLEVRQRHGQAGAHVIPILPYPWHLDAEDQEAWLAEQLACNCQPDCPGKRVGALVPEKAPSAEAWTARAHAYDTQRRGRHA
jgi:hypothetical protein